MSESEGLHLVYIGSPENGLAQAGHVIDLAGVTTAVFGRKTQGRELGVARHGLVAEIGVALPWVSGRHCELNITSHDPLRATLIDLGSRNGTRLAGALVRGSAATELGQVFEVGRSFWMLRQGRVCRSEDPPHPLLDDDHEHLQRAARSRMPMLVSGPRGVGKRRVASWMHRTSGRPGSFVSVDLSGPTSALRERLLPDSTATVPALRQARDGTLCLAGVDALSLQAQSLVREVLAAAADAQGLDVRVIVTSTRDLRQAVAQGTFGRELFARLSGCHVHVPGLHERADQLGVLIRSFFSGDLGPELHVTTEAFRFALDYAWPHNMQQLGQALTDAMTIASREGWVGRPVLEQAVEQAESRAQLDPFRANGA